MTTKQKEVLDELFPHGYVILFMEGGKRIHLRKSNLERVEMLSLAEEMLLQLFETASGSPMKRDERGERNGPR